MFAQCRRILTRAGEHVIDGNARADKRTRALPQPMSTKLTPSARKEASLVARFRVHQGAASYAWGPRSPAISGPVSTPYTKSRTVSGARFAHQRKRSDNVLILTVP